MTYADVVFDQKLTYLRRLLKIYVRFLKYYSDVEINVGEKMIEVKYCKAKNNGYTFQAIEFPREHLGRRIAHYRGKIKNMVKNRHTNTGWMGKEGTFKWSDGVGSKITFVESRENDETTGRDKDWMLYDEEAFLEKVRLWEAKYGIDLSTNDE